MRSEKDVRLRVDLLEAQSSSIARMLAKAIRDNNRSAFTEYAERLAANRDKIENLLWVLDEKPDQRVLDLKVEDKNSTILVRNVIEKVRVGELKMEDLSSDVQALVRKGALELKNERNNGQTKKC